MVLFCLSYVYNLLLLLLSHFSRVRLCVTPQTAAHQAPPSLGFSRQEQWRGLSFPSPMQESEREVAQSCPTLYMENEIMIKVNTSAKRKMGTASALGVQRQRGH